MNTITLTAHDGHKLAGYCFKPENTPHASVVIAPAMAVPQSFYAPFARYLTAQGYVVWSFDYRGTGESLKGSMRNVKATISDWLRNDFDAVIQKAGDSYPSQPLYVIGHSLGGQTVPLLPSLPRLAGLINIAVGSGWVQHNAPRVRRTAPFLWYLVAPLLCSLFGYFPGARLGIIGDLPAGVMYQWRRWCLTPDYLLSGEPGARDAYASVNFPILALTFADDELLLEKGSRMLHSAYTGTPADYRVIEPGDFGLRRIGHFGFFKQQSETTLWPLVTGWLKQTTTELTQCNS